MKLVPMSDIVNLGRSMVRLEDAIERMRPRTKAEIQESRIELVAFLTRVIQNTIDEKGAAYLATVPAAQLAAEMVAGIQVVGEL